MTTWYIKVKFNGRFNDELMFPFEMIGAGTDEGSKLTNRKGTDVERAILSMYADDIEDGELEYTIGLFSSNKSIVHWIKY